MAIQQIEVIVSAPWLFANLQGPGFDRIDQGKSIGAFFRTVNTRIGQAFREFNVLLHASQESLATFGSVEVSGADDPQHAAAIVTEVTAIVNRVRGQVSFWRVTKEDN